MAFSHGYIGDVLDEYLEVELMRESNKFQKVPRPTLEEEFNKNRKNHKKRHFLEFIGGMSNKKTPFLTDLSW